MLRTHSLAGLLVALINQPAEAGPPAPNLAGRWARLEVTTALSKVPVLGDLTTQTRALSIVDLRPDGQGLSVQQEVCALDNETMGGVVQASFPPAFLRAVSGTLSHARLQPSGEGLRYIEVRPLRVAGATLAAPDSEPLPKDPDDPRLVDGDQDGHPGLTVVVSGFVKGEVYVVQRDASNLFGTVHPNARQIRGQVQWTAEQSVIGASKEMLASEPNSRPHPEAHRSYFLMTRVPNSASCEQVRARRDRLFGVNP